jgi:GNAT superfamily N-acetyltransferase
MPKLAFRPLTANEWDDFQELFGPRGACGGCWCMWWRLPRSQYNAGRGNGNRRAMKKLVDGGAITGLLAYEGARAVGWCSIAQRGEFIGLERSRVLARVDDRPAWSIVCFFVAKDRRHTGVTEKLLEAAVRFARRNGARIIEGYPVEPGSGGTADAFAYTGLASVFRRAGFTEAARRSPRRAVYRKTVRPLS